jgi:hypothetical protein
MRETLDQSRKKDGNMEQTKARSPKAMCWSPWTQAHITFLSSSTARVGAALEEWNAAQFVKIGALRSEPSTLRLGCGVLMPGVACGNYPILAID